MVHLSVSHLNSNSFRGLEACSASLLFVFIAFFTHSLCTTYLFTSLTLFPNSLPSLRLFNRQPSAYQCTNMLATNSINGNSSKAISAGTRTLNQPPEHQQQAPIPLPRPVTANNNSVTNTSTANMNTRPTQRTRSLRSHKPLTITTQKPTTDSESISQMQQGGSAQEIYTPLRTPRSASVRRKPVAAVPCSPVGTTPSTPLPPGKPPLQTARIDSDVPPPVAMSVKERVVRANNNKNFTNGDRDQEMTHSAGAAPFLSRNSSKHHTTTNTTTLQRGNSVRQNSNGSYSNGHGSGESINSSRSLGSNSSNEGGPLSSKRKISNGSPQSKSGGGGIGGGGGNMGQKFGEFLAISGSLLGSKKHGSDTSIKSASSNTEAASSLSSTSISSLSKETITSGSKMAKMAGTMLFSKKDSSASSISPKAPKSSLLASIFSPDSRHQPHLPHSPSRSMPMQHTSNNSTKEGRNNLPSSPMDHDMGVDDYGYPTGTQLQKHGRHQYNGSSWDMADDDKIVNWELNKTVPTSYYEDEAFGLWIRPNHEARTTISGADVEKAEKEGRDNTTSNHPSAGTKKKNRPELEDMEVLEEVLDFCKSSLSLFSLH